MLRRPLTSENAPAFGVIIIRHGQVVERAVAGVRSVDNSIRVTVDDEWHVSSLTKSMTATVAAMLVEDGLITWDTRPLDVWPELDATINPDFRNITLRQLLSHTSGLKREDHWDGADDAAPGTTVEKRRAWTARLLSEPPHAEKNTATTAMPSRTCLAQYIAATPCDEDTPGRARTDMFPH